MLTFKAVILAHPNWSDKIDSYEEGNNKAALFIGFVSGFLFNLIYFLFSYQERTWDIQMILYSILFYILSGLLGFLALIRFRDYQEEINDGR